MAGVRPTDPDAAKQLAAEIRGFVNGTRAKTARGRMKVAALALTLRSFETKTSPRGVPWRSGKSGVTADLRESGSLYAAARVEDRAPHGFAVTNRVRARTGAYYGGSHQYGRTIRAKGYEPHRFKKFSPGGKVTRHVQYTWVTNARGRLVRGKPLYKKAAGARPLKWRTPDGRWHSAYKVRLPARPIVPRRGELPPLWAAALAAAAYRR